MCLNDILFVSLVCIPFLYVRASYPFPYLFIPFLYVRASYPFSYLFIPSCMYPSLVCKSFLSLPLSFYPFLVSLYLQKKDYTDWFFFNFSYLLICLFFKIFEKINKGYGIRDTASFLLRYTIREGIHTRYGIFSFKIRHLLF